MDETIPSTGKTGSLPTCPGDLNGRGRSGSRYRRMIAAAFTTRKVTKSVKFAMLATNAMFPKKRKTIDPRPTVNIAIHGVWLWGWTLERNRGRDPAFAMP